MQRGVSSSVDFYVVANGLVSCLEDLLQHGAVYHLEPCLRGGSNSAEMEAASREASREHKMAECRDQSERLEDSLINGLQVIEDSAATHCEQRERGRETE
ncbi:hypothetical protein VZT92_022990 [Zoarces viviparus]|uniref:Uncharacterized protein n=1 Tax=Zoarces viviparus TaxID=48416 RepID=A0AAW1E4V7_ZOAVI